MRSHVVYSSSSGDSVEGTKFYKDKLIWNLQNTPADVIAFAQRLLEGKVYQHVKFGITTGVKWRFFDCFSSATCMKPHCLEWGRMYIVYASWGCECGQLEKDLIKTFGDNKKVQNILRGGEQAQPETPSYVYILANDLDEVVNFGMYWMRKRAKARRNN